MFRTCETEHKIDKHLISFLQDNPFFAELSRHIHKAPSNDLPTAAVTFDPKSGDLALWWHPPFFFGGDSKLPDGKVRKYAGMSDWEIRGVITHEYYHLVFGHLFGRRREPGHLWNIATDLAINSIIVTSAAAGNTSAPGALRLSGDRPLPEFALIPGVFPKHPAGREYTKDEEYAQKLGALIEKFPPLQASEWYFEKIKQASDEDKAKGGKGFEGEPGDGMPGGPGGVDDHGSWDDIPEELREYVEGKVKSIVEKAAKTADSQANGWGNIPGELVEAIRKSVSTIINWRNILRQFVGSLVRGGRSTSIKRINKRYPYVHPGVKRSYDAKLLIAIDQSGSVSNEMLVEFFAELGTLTKKVTIDVIPFDTIALEKDLYTWRRGQNVPAKRVRGGDTDFDAPTQFANDPKNRGRWDGLLIMTDGECGKPASSRIKRGYVIGKGHKLMFPTNDIVVQMTDQKAAEGAWR